MKTLLVPSLLFFALLLSTVTGHQEHSQEVLERILESEEELERKWGFEVCLFSMPVCHWMSDIYNEQISDGQI